MLALENLSGVPPGRGGGGAGSSSPMRMVRDSPATPELPMSILELPVVRLDPAPNPNATFSLPVVLLLSARLPTAVLRAPVVLSPSAAGSTKYAAPTAVLPRQWCYFRALQGHSCYQGGVIPVPRQRPG